MKHFVVAASCLFFCMAALAQSSRCGTKESGVPYRVDPNFSARTAAVLPVAVKIYVHIFAQDNGSQQACTEADMLRQIENMKWQYTPQQICFTLVGIDVLRNTDLNNMDASNEESELLPFRVPGVINIFIHRTLFDNDGDLNGVAYGIPNNYLSMVGSAVESTDNISTLAHEMGHCFSLYHTFARGFGRENIFRSGSCVNCEDAGDLLCDTEADPHTDNNDTGEDIDEDCNYSDDSQFQNCDGGPRFHYNMDPRNIMAYGRRPCRFLFTGGQGGRALFALLNSPTLTDRTVPDDLDITISATLSSGTRVYTAKTAVQVAAPAFTVSGNGTIAHFVSHTVVIFKSGTEFRPTGNGYVEAHVSTLCQ